MKTAVEYLIGYINHLNKNGYQFNPSNDKNIMEKALEIDKDYKISLLEWIRNNATEDYNGWEFFGEIYSSEEILELYKKTLIQE
jgi:hypothetical protein